MELSQLTAVSPIDGRYWKSCESLSDYFSEFALIRYRVKVEVEYFIALTEIPLPQLEDFPHDAYKSLRDLADGLSVDDAQEVKDIEKITNHDVKAIEYFLKKKFDEFGLSRWKEFIHFGLTSQDINNTSFPMMVKNSLENVFYPELFTLTEKLEQLSTEWENVSMLARTHGQPASPTKLGKEIRVFLYRLKNQLDLLKQIPHSGKFGGATGNFNAHTVAYPQTNWTEFANGFLEKHLGIKREELTTQISNYDNLAALLEGLQRINTIILDLDRDMWTYISMNYFKQKIKEGEVGSSAMPHKVNPIDFENSEGNIGIANALYSHLAQKLPVSRLQRDLTDSTVLRNVGVPLSHSLLAIKSTLKGLNKLLINLDAIEIDLEEMWSVVAEGIQTILRRENYPNPYETLKKLTRVNTKITKETIHEFIDSLEVSEKVKRELKQLTPQNYTGR